jgi:magnesium chelatase subunit D
MIPAYPWSAVVGQPALKQALLLCAIDPAIGGVLVHGPRGVAKTTLSRALADLVTGKFVELPLGASEERVTGTLNLEVALREARVEFSPGLLARAHEGVLYVDEVNLLPDHLVDLLLDAAASGRNVVERDGVSHTHPARFVLVGTMNPEEGELRPQLIDRFGLSASAASELGPEERAEIVLRRLEYDRDPQGFAEHFVHEQRELIERCRRAREKTLEIPLSGPPLARVSALCHAARVEGVRADLAMLRAARAHAAWHDRSRIEDHDVDAVAELALAHRRRAHPEPPGGSSRGGSSTPSSGSGTSSPSSSPRGGGANTRPSGDMGALAPVPVPEQFVPALPAWLSAPRGLRAGGVRYGKGRITSRRGKRGAVSSTGPIDWFATLARAGRPERRHVQRRARRSAPEQLWIIALDCSSSMLRGGALSLAKGVAHAFERNARAAGARLALISFRGASAQLELTTGAGRSAYGAAIARLGAGGGTPLHDALQAAIALCKRPSFRARNVAKRFVLLTDGRISLAQGPTRFDAREPLDLLAALPRELESLLIDCERGPIRLGRAQPLARAIGARYLRVDELLTSAP